MSHSDNIPALPDVGDSIVVQFPWGLLRKKGVVVAKDVDGVEGVYTVKYKKVTLTDYLKFPWNYAADSPKHIKVPKRATEPSFESFTTYTTGRKRTATNFYTVEPFRRRTCVTERLEVKVVEMEAVEAEAFSDSDDEGTTSASHAMMQLSMTTTTGATSSSPISTSSEEDDDEEAALKRIRDIAHKICNSL